MFFSLGRRWSSVGRLTVDISKCTLTIHSEITDTRYRHALWIFRDKDSGCVRFEVTARRGPLKTIPIWTAFVTQYIGHRGWMKRVGASTIQFGELQPYVFCEPYKVPKGPTGRYQLTFTTPEGRLNLQTSSETATDTAFRREVFYGLLP
jgi:hypothetical protein